MRGINYFNLKYPNFLRDGNSIEYDEYETQLDKLETWKKALSNDDFNNLVQKRNNINILIPYHNSGKIIDTIKSIINSSFPKDFSKKIYIVCSACKPEYIEKVNVWINQNSSQYLDYSFEVIEQPIPGKPKALNTGLSIIPSDIIIQAVDDCTLSSNAIPLLYLSLATTKNYGASVVAGVPANLNSEKLLMKVQKLHHENFYVNDQYALVGRCFAFRKSLIPNGFPEHIMSEDFWLEIMCRESSEGFLVMDGARIYYDKPETWKDYLKQIDRFDGSFKQLKYEYKDLFQKHFGDIKNLYRNFLKPGFGKKSLMEAWQYFIQLPGYSFITKMTYLSVIAYQLYYLGIKNKIKPVKSAAFKREESTIS